MINTTYRRQGEGEFPFDYYTKERTARGDINLKGWGIYGRSSVMAGQAMKQFLDSFETEEELDAALVKVGIDPAEVNWSNKWMEPVPSYHHLPDEGDW